jgi:protein-S-isoprenylcysteine O-methyltransferase Ste14
LGLDPLLSSTPSLRSGERIANLLLGLSFPALGVSHVLRAEPGAWSSPVTWTTLALAVCVGALFARRVAVRREPTRWLVLQAVPALAIPIWAQAVTPSPVDWPLLADSAFVLGGALTVTSLLTLGRSFAILPAVRSVVAFGPYRLVRHPAYAGELVMVTACVLARPDWVTLAPLFVGVPLVALRIRAEERLLREEPSYISYESRVRWRLIPYVW